MATPVLAPETEADSLEAHTKAVSVLPGDCGHCYGRRCLGYGVVDAMKRTQRGFAIYTEFSDLYGCNIAVVRSGLVGTRAVWIQNEVKEHLGEHLGNAHLSVAQAKRVIRALQAFVDGKE
jgi:hypothetical protein